jgi:hypothetical protein
MTFGLLSMCMPRILQTSRYRHGSCACNSAEPLPASHPVGRHTRRQNDKQHCVQKTVSWLSTDIQILKGERRSCERHKHQTPQQAQPANTVTPRTPHVPNCGAAPLTRLCFDSAHAVHSTNTTTAKHVQKAFNASTTDPPPACPAANTH